MKFRSNRTPGTGLFLFMDNAKQSARAGGKAIIDLSVGASDLPAPREALKTLISAVEDPSTHSCGSMGHGSHGIALLARFRYSISQL